VVSREPGDVGLCPPRAASRHRVCGVGGYRRCTRGDRRGGPRRRAPIVDEVWTTGHTHRLGDWLAGDELMPWLVLLRSAVLEAVWATALGASDGLTRVVPAVVFLIALVVSMIGLDYATKTIPMSTAYTVWTGTGAALAVAWWLVTGAEPLPVLRLVVVLGTIASAVGLKLLKAPPPPQEQEPEPVSAAGQDKTSPG